MSVTEGLISLGCTACGARSEVPIAWVDIEELSAVCPSCGVSDKLDPAAHAQLIDGFRAAAAGAAAKVEQAIAVLDAALGLHQNN